MEESLPKQEIAVSNKEAPRQETTVARPRSQSDRLGQVIGMLVFLLGVVLLVIVFQAAHTLFSRPPDAALGLTFTGKPETDPSAGKIGTQFGYLLFQVACLFVMSIAGSLIAQKGVNLYFSAIRIASSSDAK